MSDDLMMQIAHTLASLDRRIARLEVGEAPASSGTAGTASMTASEILTAIKTVDGASSGLDADLLDGSHAAAFSGTAHTHTGYVGTASYTAADVLSKLLTVDGTGTGLDADKLDGLESTAFVGTAFYTAADVLSKLLTVDGTASLLDADKLDGLEGSAYSGTAHTHTTSGDIITTNIRMAGTAGLSLRDSAYNRVAAFLEDTTANFTVGGTAFGTNALGTITAYGGLDIKQGGTFGSALIVGGSANITGNTTIGGTATMTGGANVGAAIDTSGTATALVLKQGGGTILYTDRTSAESILSIGNGRTADGNAMIRLVGDTTYTAYGVELYRNAGANGSTAFFHRGTGDLQFNTIDAAAWKVLTNNALRLTIASSGEATFTSPLSIGQASDPVAKLRPAAGFVLADAATRVISTSPYGFVFIICTSEVSVAIFGATGATAEISDPSNLYTVTKNTASSHNVYVESGSLILQNKRGGNRTYYVFHLGITGAA